MPVCNCHPDGAVEVGAERFDVPVAQSGDHGVVRVAEEIVSAAGDHRDPRPHRGEDGLRGRAAAAVVSDLQEVRATDVVRELRLRFMLDVARQQRGEASGSQAQHDRAVVFGGAAIAVRGHSSLNAHGSDPSPVSIPSEVDGNMLLERGGEKLLRARTAEQARRDPELVDTETTDHGGKASAMIRMNVRQHDGLDVLNAAIDEHR
jgi:hypothetical protein